MGSFIHQLPLLSTVGLVLLFGFLGSRLARRLGLPSVTGYLFAGVIVGHSVLGWIKDVPDSHLSITLENLSIMALGIIAFDIGSELRFSKLRRTGKNVLPIALLESVGSFFAVTGTILLFAWIFPSLVLRGASFKDIVPLALILGAISSATAPAATLAIINEYRAKGPLTETLLGVVALDDGFCIMIFGMTFPVALALAGGAAAGSPLTFSGLVLGPLQEIALSLCLGIVAGLIIVLVLNYVRGKSSHMVIILGVILLLCGLASHWHLSPLLTNMAFGCLITNSSRRSGSVISSLESIEPPLFVAFFTIAGIHLNLKLLGTIGGLGLIYFIARIIGKSGGASIGAALSRAPKTVRKYIGLGLIPQAGVAIGLVLLVQEHPVLAELRVGGQTIPSIITNCILASVALNELLGPLAAKIALSKAGEINVEGKK